MYYWRWGRHTVTDMRISAMYHVPDNDGRVSEEKKMILELGTWMAHGMNTDFDCMDMVEGNL